MKRTGIEMWKREEMIENYILTNWALGETATRNYKKIALLQVQEEIERQVEKVTNEIANAPARTDLSLETALSAR